MANDEFAVWPFFFLPERVIRNVVDETRRTFDLYNLEI